VIILESVDVNVTPDKRQLFIENEKILLALLKGYGSTANSCID
jgi:DNA mismatch repair ATPase MutL